MSSTKELFLKLVSINGLSGQEKDMATFLEAYLDGLGWQTWFDDSGPKHHSNTGNLYALLEVKKDLPTLVFVAHTDTVIEQGQTVRPIVKGNVVYSDGTTILGADNRAGVCALLLVAEKLARHKPSYNILFVFTTREEAGIMGSSYFAYDQLINCIFNVDSTDAPGVFVTQSNGYETFTIVVHGLSAHAAKEFEKGKHAIVLASELLLQLPIGGSKVVGWSCNIGTIHGGERTNVIPDLVTMHGEIRAETKEQMDQLMDQIKTLCQKHAAARDAQIDFVPDASSYIPPFHTDIPELLARCAASAKAVGLKPVFTKVYSTSDANFLSAHGAPTISVSRGGQSSHSHRESISLTDIETTSALLLALMK